MKIKKCPEDCAFDWGIFQIQFDMAMAHAIDEINKYPDFVFLPSKTSCLDLMKYVNEKAKLQYGVQDIQKIRKLAAKKWKS